MSMCTIHCQQKVRECLKGLDSSKIRIGPVRNSIIFFPERSGSQLAHYKRQKWDSHKNE